MRARPGPPASNCWLRDRSLLALTDPQRNDGPMSHEPVRAPRGSQRSCKGWAQEAAMRMLMNNLDPEVAEHPDQLIVYGGSGRAARSWEAYAAIMATLQGHNHEQTP